MGRDGSDTGLTLMKYYTKEIWNEEGYQRTAGIKARDDVDRILEKNGYEAIEICMPQADRDKVVNIITIQAPGLSTDARIVFFTCCFSP